MYTTCSIPEYLQELKSFVSIYLKGDFYTIELDVTCFFSVERRFI